MKTVSNGSTSIITAISNPTEKVPTVGRKDITTEMHNAKAGYHAQYVKTFINNKKVALLWKKTHLEEPLL